MKLFGVYLGGKAKNANIEVHDMVFVIGKDIKSCFPKIKEKWFGDPNSVHIDSWCELSQIKGYRIELSSIKNSSQFLFFVNLGFSIPDTFGELHLMDFIPSDSKENSKIKAKTLFPNKSSGHHLDNLVMLSKIENWNINLIEDPTAKGLKFENVYWKL